MTGLVVCGKQEILKYFNLLLNDNIRVRAINGLLLNNDCYKIENETYIYILKNRKITR